MAQYRDTDEILRKLDDYYITAIVQQKHDDLPEDHAKHWKGVQSGINYARNTIIEAPTADVAPKSEVAREIIGEIKAAFEQYGGRFGMRQKLEELEKRYGRG